MRIQTNAVSVFAPAKVNLTLHVTGQRDDGYHLLDSLVVFATVGDLLNVQPGNTLSLSVEGPEAAGVPADMGNLVMRVASLFKDTHGASFVLQKNLPPASGIGGGSADAAAAFRALMSYRSDSAIDPEIFDPARTPMATELGELGADIPVCLQSVPRRMRGVGTELEDLPDLPMLFAVLVNPRVSVSTPHVFKALETKQNSSMPDQIPRFSGLHDFVNWLSDQRNDLQAPACRVAPIISDTLSLLNSDPTCMLARMSGSGATCFGLYDSKQSAIDAANAVLRARRNWWVHAVKLGSMGQASLPKLTQPG